MSRWKTEFIRRGDQAVKVFQSRLRAVAFEAIFKVSAY